MLLFSMSLGSPPYNCPTFTHHIPPPQRVSYLSAAQDTRRSASTTHKTDIKPEIKSELNASVNISSLVGAFPHPNTSLVQVPRVEQHGSLHHNTFIVPHDT